jgi:hypothetical protein
MIALGPLQGAVANAASVPVDIDGNVSGNHISHVDNGARLYISAVHPPVPEQAP